MFDSVTWESDADRVQYGNLVFADHCRRCHGPLGEGDTEYARQNELDVPSLIDPAWEMAEDPEAVRRHVFSGHVGGMPTWGVGRLTPREIDAAVHYILAQLRPEVLGDDVGARPDA
jgi:mono/diheme cytochrome c family protein